MARAVPPRLSHWTCSSLRRTILRISRTFFTEEDLECIINYDIKYRMGRDAEENE